MARSKVPQYIRDAAAEGIRLKEEGYAGAGGKALREARAMARGEISDDKMIRANAWAKRHAVDLEGNKYNTDKRDPDFPGAGAVAHYLWGIDPTDPEPAWAWFERQVEKIRSE